MNEAFTRKDLDELLAIYKECEIKQVRCSAIKMLSQITDRYIMRKATEFVERFLDKTGTNKNSGLYSVKDTTETVKMLFVQHMNDVKYWKKLQREVNGKFSHTKDEYPVLPADAIAPSPISTKVLIDRLEFKDAVSMFFEYLKKHNCECTIRRIEEFKL